MLVFVSAPFPPSMHPLPLAARRLWSNFPLRTKGIIAVSIPLGAMLFGFVASYLVNREQDRASVWLLHTERVRAQIQLGFNHFNDAETGVRSFLLTRREEFLEPYRHLGQSAPALFAQLAQVVRDDPAQAGRLQRVHAAAEASQRTLADLAAHPESAASVSGPGREETKAELCRRQLDDLWQAFSAMDAEESRLEGQRAQELARVERWRDVANVGGVLFGLLGALAAARLFSNGIVRQVFHLRANARRLAQELPLLPLDAGHDEIGALARDLDKAGGLLLERKRALEASFQEIRQARDEAERANRAKSEFLSRMSHELRTPLNAILGFGQLLNLQETDEKKLECLEHITQGGTHLLELINEVLDIARIESGRLELEPAAVDVSATLGLSLNLVRPLTEAHGIRLQPAPEFGADRRFVRADPQRLRQVLINLLANAIKYNRPGGEVRVSCEPGQTEGSLRLMVHDTGPGLSAEQCGRLFVPFERLGAEHSRVEGTGLGLALSRHLVQAMDGQLGVDSVVGEGSAFWVELPGAVPPDEASPHRREERWLPGAGVVSTGLVARYKVLYIEDNASNLELVERVLDFRPEFRLLSAPDGGTGLATVREQRPDLILLDLGLPDIPGTEVLRRLQADEATREIPVVIMSTDAAPDQVDRLLGLGASAYLTKPFQIQELLQLVEELSLGGAARGGAGWENGANLGSRTEIA